MNSLTTPYKDYFKLKALQDPADTGILDTLILPFVFRKPGTKLYMGGSLSRSKKEETSVRGTSTENNLDQQSLWSNLSSFPDLPSFFSTLKCPAQTSQSCNFLIIYCSLSKQDINIQPCFFGYLFPYEVS